MFVYFNLLNYNESLFYTLKRVIIYHLIKMIQRTNKNHNKSLKKIIIVYILDYNTK